MAIQHLIGKLSMLIMYCYDPSAQEKAVDACI